MRITQWKVRFGEGGFFTIVEMGIRIRMRLALRKEDADNTGGFYVVPVRPWVVSMAPKTLARLKELVRAKMYNEEVKEICYCRSCKNRRAYLTRKEKLIASRRRAYTTLPSSRID